MSATSILEFRKLNTKEQNKKLKKNRIDDPTMPKTISALFNNSRSCLKSAISLKIDNTKRERFFHSNVSAVTSKLRFQMPDWF